MFQKQAQQLNSFERLYKKKLGLDETEEMRRNFFGFMNLLIEIDEEIKQKKEQSND